MMVGYLISGINDFKKAKESNYSFPTSHISLHKLMPEIQDSILRNNMHTRMWKSSKMQSRFSLRHRKCTNTGGTETPTHHKS